MGNDLYCDAVNGGEIRVVVRRLDMVVCGGDIIEEIHTLYIMDRFKFKFYTENNILWLRCIKALHKIKVFDGKPLARASLKGTWLCIANFNKDLEPWNLHLDTLMVRKTGNGTNTHFWKDKWLGEELLKNNYPELFRMEVEKDCKVADRILGMSDYGWNWKRSLRRGRELNTLEDLKRDISNVPLSVASHTWRWKSNTDGRYSVHSLRMLMVDRDPHGTGEGGFNWVSWIPLKISCFVWRLRMNTIPLSNNLASRGISVTSNVWNWLCNWSGGLIHVAPIDFSAFMDSADLLKHDPKRFKLVLSLGYSAEKIPCSWQMIFSCSPSVGLKTEVIKPNCAGRTGVLCLMCDPSLSVFFGLVGVGVMEASWSLVSTFDGFAPVVWVASSLVRCQILCRNDKMFNNIVIWKCRNDKMFNNISTTPMKAADNVMTMVFDWVKYRGSFGNCNWAKLGRAHEPQNRTEDKPISKYGSKKLSIKRTSKELENYTEFNGQKNQRLAKDIWSAMFRWLQTSHVNTSHPGELFEWVDGWRGSRNRRLVLEAVLCITFWMIWRFRNDVVHESRKMRKDMIVDNIKEISFVWVTNRFKKTNIIVYLFIIG
ncbi:hypothetical protein LXL04_032214 [Taraxacum kok-saghyz]